MILITSPRCFYKKKVWGQDRKICPLILGVKRVKTYMSRHFTSSSWHSLSDCFLVTNIISIPAWENMFSELASTLQGQYPRFNLTCRISLLWNEISSQKNNLLLLFVFITINSICNPSNGKKMARVVHFTTIPCKLQRSQQALRKLYFWRKSSLN